MAYPLVASYTGKEKRPDKWAYDPEIDEKWQASLVDYSYPAKEYDRGHQIPNADRNCNASIQAQTFYCSNSTPQNNKLNGGEWAQLEGRIRSSWMCADTLYVVTGAWFDPNRTPPLRLRHQGSGQGLPRAHALLESAAALEVGKHRKTAARASGLGAAKHRILDGPRRQELVERRIERLQRPRNRAAHGLHVLRERSRRSEEHMGRHALERALTRSFRALFLAPTSRPQPPLLAGVVFYWRRIRSAEFL